MRYLYDKYDTLENVLEVENGQHPVILKEYLGKNVTAETIIAFDLMFGVFGDYDELIQEQFIWPQHKKKLTKLKPFIEYERDKLRTVMREIWIPRTS